MWTSNLLLYIDIYYSMLEINTSSLQNGPFTMIQSHSRLHFCFIRALCYHYSSVIALATITIRLQWGEGLTVLLFLTVWLCSFFLAKAHRGAITFWQWLSSFSQHHCTALSLLLYTWLVQKWQCGKKWCCVDCFFRTAASRQYAFDTYYQKLSLLCQFYY